MRDLRQFPARTNRWFPFHPLSEVGISHIVKQYLVDKTYAETISGSWQFLLWPYETYTNVGTTLDSTDFGKVHIFDNGVNDVDCDLMSVATANMVASFICVRLGTGKLRMIAADADTILNSSAGGSIECTDATARGDYLIFRQIAETKWTVSGFGIWSVR